MFRGRALMLIMLSLLLAAGATVAASRWLAARAQAQSGRPQMVTVVTAAADIPFGTAVEERHVTTIEMPVGALPRGAVTRKEDVVGKVAGGALIAGEMLIAERFVEQGQGSTLAAVVAKDMRAITVRVNDVVGVGGFLLPGNRIDLLATRDFNGTREAETRTILQNVKVLAIDQTASTDKNEPVVVRAVTLEVKPSDAELIAKAQVEGKIQLTLRNPLDDRQAVVEEKPKPAPEKPRAVVARAEPEPVIQVIRGTQLDSERKRR